jgi:hypothetical protein
MIRIGAEVKPGHIIGKLLQKENQILLQKRNCFVQSWDKAGDVKDASLKALLFTWCCFRQKLFARAVKINVNVHKTRML